jgi:DNA-binding XRE family transcriptional regulator
MLRAERKVTRRELADALGVHYQTVGYLERGEYSPSLYLALRIAAYFEVPVEVIFSTEPFPRLGSASAASASLAVVPVRGAVAVEAVVGPLGIIAPGGIGVLAALLRQQRTLGGACHGACHGGGGLRRNGPGTGPPGVRRVRR